MSKANRRSRFAIDRLFEKSGMHPKLKRLFLTYLNHEDIIARTKQVVQALSDIKQRKRQERHLINLAKHRTKQRAMAVRKRRQLYQKSNREIQYGYDLVNWWRLQHE